MRFGIALLVLLGLVACSGQQQPPPATVDQVNLERYLGQWYEIARLPAWFQRDCQQSQAIYEKIDAETIAVTNRCPTAEGEMKVATGTATVMDPDSNAKLKVVFDNWFSTLTGGLIGANYWVLALDADYQTAMVGTPDRDYLWILAREPRIPQQRLRALIDQAAEQGYPVDELVIHQ